MHGSKKWHLANIRLHACGKVDVIDAGRKAGDGRIGADSPCLGDRIEVLLANDSPRVKGDTLASYMLLDDLLEARRDASAVAGSLQHFDSFYTTQKQSIFCSALDFFRWLTFIVVGGPEYGLFIIPKLSDPIETDVEVLDLEIASHEIPHFRDPFSNRHVDDLCGGQSATDDYHVRSLALAQLLPDVYARELCRPYL